MQTIKATVINYFDVWGNEKDGWEVNNQCLESKTLELPEDFNNADLLKELKAKGFIKKHCRLNMLNFEQLGFESIEISERRNGMPIYCINYDYEAIEEINPYDQIIDSYLNGQKKQCLEQFKVLNVDERKELFDVVSTLLPKNKENILTFLLTYSALQNS